MDNAPAIKGSLNAKQALFVKEYLVDLNATQAAIRSGYSVRSAPQLGHGLLRKHEIASRIASELQTRVGITHAAIVDEMAKTAFANLGDMVNEDGHLKAPNELTRDQTAALSELTIDTYQDGRNADAKTVKRVKYKLAPKMEALNALAKITRLSQDQVTVEHVDASADPHQLARAVYDVLTSAKGDGAPVIDLLANTDTGQA